MKPEDIAKPVAADNPAGPDLWADDDALFGDYYFNALDRLPEAGDYVRLGMTVDDKKTPDVIFDPKSVDLDDEIGAIDKLLARSRDLRLLSLRAQTGILAGDLKVCTESVEAMAALLEAMPEQAHPVIGGDGPRDRLEAINDLGLLGAMILPLRYLDIAASGVSLRRMMVARGKATAHDGEEDLEAADLLASLGDRADDLAQVRDQLSRFRGALARIETASISHPQPHTPRLQTLKDELAALAALLAEAVPDLAVAADDDAGTDADADTGGGPAAPAAAAARPAARVAAVTDMADATRRLVAVERYFRRNEPSSAALLMVTQARLLIGKSLIDAFDTLMPQLADQARVRVAPDRGLQLAYSQLRELSNQVSQDDPAGEDDAPAPEPDRDQADDTPPEPSVDPSPEPPSAPAVAVRTAAEASAQIQAVETYFMANEKSSPVPMLLARARSYVGKDFEALLRDLMPAPDA